MIEPDPTNIRNRINKYTDKDRDLKMLFKATYLLGAMECEMLGAKYESDSKSKVYGPTGDDSWEKKVLVDNEQVNTVFFIIKTAKTKGKEGRTVWLPLDREPWARDVYGYFKEKGGELVFPFKRQEIYTRVKKSKVLQGLPKPKRRSFGLDNLRWVREKELKDEYGFEDPHLQAYGIIKQERRRTPIKRLDESEMNKLRKEYLRKLCKFPEAAEIKPLEKDERKIAENMFEQIITHPQIKEVSNFLFKTGNYRNAVLDAAIRLEVMIKEKTDYPKDNKGKELSGVSLMHKVFDSTNPILSWRKNETQIEKDELEGYKFIFAGTVLGIRDPKAHAIFEISPMRALKLLTLITLLAELVDASKIMKNETKAS
jgi:uncharacterized protein (TIGR02391 family)